MGLRHHCSTKRGPRGLTVCLLPGRGRWTGLRESRITASTSSQNASTAKRCMSCGCELRRLLTRYWYAMHKRTITTALQEGLIILQAFFGRLDQNSREPKLNFSKTQAKFPLNSSKIVWKLNISEKTFLEIGPFTKHKCLISSENDRLGWLFLWIGHDQLPWPIDQLTNLLSKKNYSQSLSKSIC